MVDVVRKQETAERSLYVRSQLRGVVSCELLAAKFTPPEGMPPYAAAGVTLMIPREFEPEEICRRISSSGQLL